MSKLWLWVNMMQLQNSLAILEVNTPINVLFIEKEYNDVINLAPPKGITDSIVDSLMFWKEDPTDLKVNATEEYRRLDDTSEENTKKLSRQQEA